MYVDYLYYQEYGGTMPEEDFPVAERKAMACIRYLTFINGEIFEKKEVEAVKLAVCAAADVYYADIKKTRIREAEGREGTVKSESNDGVSVSYVTEQVDGQTAEELLRKKVYEAVYMYLLPTGWLSRRVGCRNDYECGHHSL